ncbi:MAG: hypothetical protein ACRDD7_09385 [Peptostreptococcaceae bacterium]
MIPYLNTYIEQDREERTNRIIEQRCINSKGEVIEREIIRYYPDCDRRIHYIKYAHGWEFLTFYNNSNEKAMRIVYFKDNKGFREEYTIYGSQYKVQGIDAEGYKLIKQILNKLKDDEYVDFKKLYEEF